MRIYLKNTILVGGLLIAAAISFQFTTADESTHSFEQQPPIPLSYRVQQLEQMTDEGNLILKVTFARDPNLSEELRVVLGGSKAYYFKDDGQFPDKKAKDYEYAVLLKQDPNDFINTIEAKQQSIKDRGYVFKFTGHLGALIEAEEIADFDKVAFNQFEAVPIDPIIINEIDCEQDLEKKKSLFITDLRVVENPARTYNIVSGEGNPDGAWTFGHLMRNMAGGLPPNPTTEEILFVRDFVRNWIEAIVAEYTITGIYNTPFEVTDNSNALFGNRVDVLSSTWLAKAAQYLGEESMVWEDIDTKEELDALLINAPFKLTAIVNRLDLRGNSGYGNSMANTGETRFIYSYVLPFAVNSSNFIGEQGMPPFHLGTGAEEKQFIDWQGMNVILEYGNVENSLCELKERALRWASLSTYDWELEEDLEDYLYALELLTNDVTAAGAAAQKPNGSAINQVRSNEKLLDPAQAPNQVQDSWFRAHWQLRQYELDANSGMLVNAPVSNVPAEKTNHSYTINGVSALGYSSILSEWLYDPTQINFLRVKFGNHNLPDNLLQPIAGLHQELMHFFGLEHSVYPYNSATASNQELIEAKDIRKQLSLNTCGGCHGAETKTPFTMIRPLGYGEEADYWSEIPSSTTGIFDGRDEFTPLNNGKTWDEYLQEAVPNYELEYYAAPDLSTTEFGSDIAPRTVPNVAAFLTGRNYRGAEGLWQDDFYSDPNNPDNIIGNENNLIGDDDLTGVFYVNDPSNEASNAVDSAYWPFPKQHDRRDGFNDLERRKMDLCKLTQACCPAHDCAKEPLFSLMERISFIPLPKGSH